MSKSNFMRNVRMEFPQYVSNVSSYEDSVKILKGKRILSEAAKPEGVYGHNPNAETPPEPGIDQLNYYQVYHGIQYELAQMPEITDETYIKARKKVVANILKDPDAYKQLQLANFKAVKEMDQDLKMKEVKTTDLIDKPNEMKVIKKDAKANTEDTLEKKEKRKAKNPRGVTVMTQTPKKAKGIAKVMEVPAKEKTLKESTMLREEDLQQYGDALTSLAWAKQAQAAQVAYTAKTDAALFAAAQKSVDDLEQQVFEKVGVLLVYAGRDQQLPGALAAMLDRVQQVGLARPLVPEHRDHLGVGGGVIAVQVDDVQEQVAFRGVQLRHVVTRANVVIRVAGEVVAKRIAGASEGFHRALAASIGH